LSVAAIDEHDVQRMADVVRSGWLTHGPCNEELEAAFASYLGVRNAVSLNSCASALHLAILALGITGEIILPSFTFVASANAVVTAGAIPVYADIRYDDCTIDPAAIEAAVTPRTEGIMPVHYAGQACDMDAIMAIARRHGLAVIEDSAENIGGDYRGRKAGTFGVGCYSLYPTKNMTTGEGGMLVTDDDELAATVRTYSGHGVSSSTLARERAERPWLRAATRPGYNFRMSNVLAALGVGQLARIDDLNARRRAHAAWYAESMGGIAEIDLPVERPDRGHVWQMYTVKLRGVDRSAFLAGLRARGIEATVHFDPPVHRQPYYAQLLDGARPELPVTDEVAESICTLPMFPSMTVEQRELVSDGVRAEIAQARQPVPAA
jgi:perosamine synthetase